MARISTLAVQRAVTVADDVPHLSSGSNATTSCAICLEEFAVEKMVTLLCCKQKLCIVDAQRVGVCCFCRSEPLMWCCSGK
jgi:hypothetical protein